MSVLELSRWQFGITTVYHFLFVPITIGLAFLVAGFETAWLRTGNERWLPADEVLRQAVPDQLRDRRGHRDRAGVPVRHELVGLLALRRATSSARRWRSRRCWRSSSSPRSSACGSSAGTGCRRGVHAACIWMAAIGTLLSAYFILAANSWMQHPVGYRYNPVTHREELTSIVAVLTNPTAARHVPAHDRRLLPGRRRRWSAAVAAWHLTAPGRAPSSRRHGVPHALQVGLRSPSLVARRRHRCHRGHPGQADDRSTSR